MYGVRTYRVRHDAIRVPGCPFMEAGLGIDLRGLTSWRARILGCVGISFSRVEPQIAGMAKGFSVLDVFPLLYRESCDFPPEWRSAWLSQKGKGYRVLDIKNSPPNYQRVGNQRQKTKDSKTLKVTRLSRVPVKSGVGRGSRGDRQGLYTCDSPDISHDHCISLGQSANKYRLTTGKFLYNFE